MPRHHEGIGVHYILIQVGMISCVIKATVEEHGNRIPDCVQFEPDLVFTDCTVQICLN